MNYPTTDMSQEHAEKDGLEAHRERVRKIIGEERDVLDELA